MKLVDDECALRQAYPGKLIAELKAQVMPTNSGIVEAKLEEAKQEVNPMIIKEPVIKE
jgi:hypothetical protein